VIKLLFTIHVLAFCTCQSWGGLICNLSCIYPRRRHALISWSEHRSEHRSSEHWVLLPWLNEAMHQREISVLFMCCQILCLVLVAKEPVSLRKYDHLSCYVSAQANILLINRICTNGFCRCVFHIRCLLQVGNLTTSILQNFVKCGLVQRLPCTYTINDISNHVKVFGSKIVLWIDYVVHNSNTKHQVGITYVRKYGFVIQTRQINIDPTRDHTTQT
jgi:hypothetical protein